MNEKKAIRLCAMGLGLCLSILVSCLVIDFAILSIVLMLLMAIGLMTLAVGTIGLFRQRRYSVAALALIATLSLIQLSCMTWYGPHWAWGDPHRHSIWDMGHVH